MDSCIYHLTTRTRKVLIDDVREDVHLLKYAGKEARNYWNQRAGHLDARLQLLMYAWMDREGGPKYVVQGDFVPGSSVFTDWVIDPDGGPQIEIWDAPHRATFCGFLRAHGKRLRLERWHVLTKDVEDFPEAEELQNQLFSLMPKKLMISYRQETPHAVRLTVRYKDINDGVVAKMAMA